MAEGRGEASDKLSNLCIKYHKITLVNDSWAHYEF